MYQIIKKSKLSIVCLLAYLIIAFSQPSIALAGSVYYNVGPLSYNPVLWSINYGAKNYPYKLTLHESVDKSSSVQTPFYHEAYGSYYRNLYPFSWVVITQNNYYSGTTRKLAITSWTPISMILPDGYSAYGGKNGTGVTLSLTGSYVQNRCSIALDDGTVGNYDYTIQFNK